MRRTRLALALVSLPLVAAACGPGPSSLPSARPNRHTPSETVRQTPADTSNAKPDHIVVIVMENKEYGSIIGSSDAPYINRLARRNVLLTREYATRHPSLPDYLALTGGSTFGITSDCTDCSVSRSNLVDQLERTGYSWKAYMQSMPRACYTGSFAGTAPRDYAKKHNPFIYYDDIRNDSERCNKIVPFTVFKRTDLKDGLPNFAWITPNECHDMHDCSVATGDAFLHRWVPKILRNLGKDGILILTFDEGSTDDGCCSSAAGGHVATIIGGPGAKDGTRIRREATHYSVLRLIEDAWDLNRLRHAGKGSTPTIRGWRD